MGKNTIRIGKNILLILLLFFLVGIIYNRFILNNQAIINKFHKIYHASNVWQNTYCLGIQVLQNPFDLWMMQEIITEIKPDIIIETGTYRGGATLYFAMILDQINKNGKIISIDIDPRVDEASKHEVFKKVEVIKGSSVSKKTINLLREKVKDAKVLITLDSLHTQEHVLKELNLYSEFVSLGSYIVVQDTNINGHPIEPNYGPGPMEAIEEFLQTHKNFEPDKTREKFLLTFFPSGYLKRIK